MDARVQNPHRSIWLDDREIGAAQLATDTQCDVCVVGAGIAGLLVGHRLAEDGFRVVVLDAGTVGGGETGRTTAHLTSALDDRYTSLERLHGAGGARLAAEGHTAAIDYFARLAQRFQVDCQWRTLDGYLVVNKKHRDKAAELLEEEARAAARAGLEVEQIDQLAAPWPSELGPALRFARQAQIHPMRLLEGVVREMAARGAHVHRGTKVTKVVGGRDAHVITEGGPVVRCANIVVATNTPVNDIVTIHTKQAGYQTYVTAFDLPGTTLPPLLLWDGLWEDDTAYHYVRIAEGETGGGGDLLIVGGEDHKTGQGPDGEGPYHRLEAWTRRHFPMAGACVRRWSGEVMEPADALAYIGRNPTGAENVYVVTGDSGNGMTHGAIAAMIIPELIRGGQSPWSKLYDPARKIGMHALGDYARENLNTVAQYRDWLKRGDVQHEAEIAPGEGAIVTHGARHLAVYKDARGECTRMSATCPHLGGVVRWNSAEKTWDCPCHASRFDRVGKVIHGPANSDLKPAQTPEPVVLARNPSEPVLPSMVPPRFPMPS